eukprot:TRINITY_DN8595_c0_g1_i4.p1 TRINITY_DN8595_c0_g1~~TRINITY_DN8595_c0_g1_i4.p1  ORF type:complete len:1187 (+),score=321.18 TRINITY_DN8595_c0_g1_i4:422-3982(+)
MKGRSQQRLPIISDPPDDWGDGSWTVDCVCGVTFDDGEEMVNCDECGVWVHTRCSRFIKGETSFACDKCKSKKGRSVNSEETEVAQLLVELPTKTMRMDGRVPSVAPPPSCPPRPLKRLWTEIPMEDRVHVQGVPGGDPALFQGLSAVFSPQLWKCTGYVPKKFNFQYKEFPCWEDKDEEVETQGVNAVRAEEDNENQVDRGADVLFSLSKEIVPYATQVGASGGFRGLDEGESCERKLSTKEIKRRDWGKVGLSSGRMQNCVKKERNRLGPAGVHLGKWKKDESAIPKDDSGKKKSRSADKELNNKKRVGSASTTDAPKLDFDEQEDFKVGNFTDYYDMRTEGEKETLFAEPNCQSHPEAPVNSHDLERKLSMNAPAEIASEGPFDCSSPETRVKVENADQQAPVRNGIPPRVGASEIPVIETNGVAKVSMKEEDVSTAVDGLNHLKDESHNMEDLNGDSSSVAVDSKISKPPDRDQRSYAQDMHDNRMLPDSNGVVSLSSAQTNARAQIEADYDQGTVDSEFLSSVGDRKPVPVSNSLQHLVRPEEEMSKDLQLHETIIGSLQPAEHNLQDAERVLEAVSYPDTIKEGTASISCNPHHCVPESAVPLTAQEGGSKSRHGAKYIEEPSRFGPTNPISAAPSLRKLVVGIGKSSSSSTVVLSKSSVSGRCYKSMGSPASSPVAIKPTHSSKQHMKVKSSTDHKKDNAVIDVPRDEGKQEVLAPVKDRPKSPANYLLKPSHASRNSHPSTCKHSLTDVKEQMLCPSNSSSMQNVANSSGTGELSSLPQTRTVSENKPAASSLSQKSEKINQSSKVANNSPSVHPPAPVNASTTLSDEELALLLHQELNSSPRVPRVPRVRHTGSIPQLSSPTATSMLAKRTSSSGAKDHVSVSRRKNKEETCKDNSRNTRELTDETKKANRLSSSPDQRRRDSVLASDGLPKRDSSNRSPDTKACAKKSISLVSSTPSNSGPASSIEANDQTLSSMRSSPRDTSDDDGGGVTGSTRTLPGLIAEIMSKGKRMTYEELCNAVLPHWQNLRKLNGERYAYSSHSQAVLDCLRNRNEWAQLIDRGPKTNSSRKRRKLDADTSAAESEDEDARDRPLKQIEGKSVESHREEFPKGKRKARKRRRLQLQGRVLKEVRKRQKADAATDDDFGAYSSDGTESSFSDDENMGGRMGEASSSSDES